MQLTIGGYPFESRDPDDRFMVACGLYWHCADYHEGQWSDRYRILSSLGYSPGVNERGPAPGESSAVVYEALERGTITPDQLEAFMNDKTEE